MATVYLGTDLKHDRQVAIKVLHPEIAAAVGTERFLLEIKIAARLTHPHIVPLHDSGEVDGLLFYVMPFVEGESLRDRLTREKQLPVDEAIRIAREVADALDYAHNHKVLHRDIKPENILLEAGHAVVADFGVARAIGEAEAQRVTATGIAVGTPSYMSPEQAAGTRDLDGRSDLYALACVLYEMLAGQPPFIGPTVESVIRQHLIADVPNVASIRQSVTPEVTAALTRALAKTPADRFGDTRQFAAALERGSVIGEVPRDRSLRAGPRPGTRRTPRRRVLVMLSAALLALIIIAGAFTKTARVLWARTRGISSLQSHVATGNWEAAHRLAARVEEVLPNDSNLAVVRATFSDVVRIDGSPPGTRVYRKAYNSTEDWEFLGVAPLGRVLVPRLPVLSQFKFEAPGFTTAFDIGAAAAVPGANTPVVRFSLDREGTLLDDMVLVPGGEVTTGIPQLDPADRARIGNFYLDRHEVTNRDYQAFVDSGGYQRRDLWDHEFIESGRQLTWDEAVQRFVDQTGRPGPSTWEAGRYPPERATHPVAGVSWFEAAAYAKFRGKRLPNVFQWTRAARFEGAGAILSASNIEKMRGGATAPVGSFGGMTGSGAFDMAGNVREWCVNESRSAGGRFILGGGWNDAAYRFFESAIHSPFDRSATNGIRLVSPIKGDSGSTADRPIEPIFRDYRAERPVADETFQFFRRLFAYDRAPLNERLERRDSTAQWIREKVSYDAAYGRERITAVMFLPLNVRPPYQTVVFFPPSPALRARSSDSLFSVGVFDYLVHSGRAVIYPVYKGTYERDDGTRFSDPDTTNRYREHVVQWLQDVSRSIDYLTSRGDIDLTKLGFLGHSWGGRLGTVILAIEPRFTAAVLSAGGLNFRRAQPEVDDFNYAPRVRLPVLMLNGRHDNTFPLETAVKPMYELLGSRADRKRLVIAEGVHYVPRNVLIGETLNWFDRHLGRTK